MKGINKEVQFLIYQTPEFNGKINVVVKYETIWLTQKAMAELFGVKVPAISKHLKNIFLEGELEEKLVISILETTIDHGAIAGKTQSKEKRHLARIIFASCWKEYALFAQVKGGFGNRYLCRM